MKELKKQEYESPRFQVVMISKKDLITTSLTGGFNGEEDNFSKSSKNGYITLS